VSNSNYSYLPQLIVSVNTYSGKPGASTAAPTGVQTTIKFADLLDVTTTQSIRLLRSSLANGTRTDCASYFLGDVFQASTSKVRVSPRLRTCRQDILC